MHFPRHFIWLTQVRPRVAFIKRKQWRCPSTTMRTPSHKAYSLASHELECPLTLKSDCNSRSRYEVLRLMGDLSASATGVLAPTGQRSLLVTGGLELLANRRTSTTLLAITSQQAVWLPFFSSATNHHIHAGAVTPVAHYSSCISLRLQLGCKSGLLWLA